MPRPWLLSPSDLTGYNYLHICNGLQRPPHTLPAIQRVLYGPTDFLLFPIRASALIEIHTHITQHIPIHAHANTLRAHDPACSWYLCACNGVIIHRNNVLPYANQYINEHINFLCDCFLLRHTWKGLSYTGLHLRKISSLFQELLQDSCFCPYF